ncbi:hypothetical protein XEUV586_02695 [Xanthomonas euvesicatoria]|nr:hypothetical protein XEUV586_02695 [Xanthomonas euvesicatoria]
MRVPWLRAGRWCTGKHVAPPIADRIDRCVTRHHAAQRVRLDRIRRSGCQPFAAQMRRRQYPMQTGMAVRHRGVPANGKHTSGNAVVPAVRFLRAR